MHLPAYGASDEVGMMNEEVKIFCSRVPRAAFLVSAMAAGVPEETHGKP